MLECYADGSCPQPHKPGGWAYAILLDQQQEGRETNVYGSGRVDVATNNTMEMMAVHECMKRILKDRIRTRPIVIYSDSQYVVRGLMNYVHQWELRDFENVANVDLWKDMLADYRKFAHGSLRLNWVRGHAGNYWNEFVDELAGAAQKGQPRGRREPITYNPDLKG